MIVCLGERRPERRPPLRSRAPRPYARGRIPAAEENLQIHGGFRFIEESAVPRFYRDAKVPTIGEGTSEILKYVIARQLGLTE